MRFKRNGSALGRFLSSYLLRPLTQEEVLSEATTGSLLTFLENRKYYFIVFKKKVYPFSKEILSIPEVSGSERVAFPMLTSIFLEDDLRSQVIPLEVGDLKFIQDKHGRIQYICDVSTVSKSKVTSE